MRSMHAADISSKTSNNGPADRVELVYTNRVFDAALMAAKISLSGKAEGLRKTA